MSDYIHLIVTELYLNKPSIISNTWCLIIITGSLPNEPQIISAKYRTHSVLLNHCFITKYTHNYVS